MSTPQEALSLLRASDQRHQGRTVTPEVGEVTAERLAAIEAFAVSVRVWNPSVLPGLLQTTRYAVGAITSARPALPSVEVQRYAHHRAARVDQFLARWQGTAATEAVFVVGEQAITPPLVRRPAHRAQVQQLLNLGEHPKIHVRVMPAGRPAPGRPGQMSLYALEPAGPDHGKGVRVGYLETPVGGWYTTRSEDVARLHTAFADLVDAALSTDDTRTFLMEALTP
jgi:hypothetical protein